MEFKKMISVVILSLYCSVSEASEVKVLNFVEFYKTTLNDVEQYLKTNKCKYIVSKEIHKGYRKYRRVVVSECFKYPNEEVTFITLIYHNSLKEYIADEVRLVYLDKLNIFDIYQINLEKRYKNPSNKYIRNVDDRYYEWNTNDYTIVHANDNGLGLVSFLGKPDSSIGDFNFEIMTNKKILGFIELNKTSLSEVKEKLNELNSYTGS
ncbi:hypothetical protein [Anaerobiospirillum thomasii]|uniref:Uncharacterized protein n=1 Tax=Anaerobiospirillum thomasii TaxID=179995 RepID=A0A2X0WV56_9GAMM|nr:hypothetical protein [Anaerobiospirillum thomasii]SPT70382.1 Uncharacterised protein [Anaerobiospirillum thomasii]